MNKKVNTILFILAASLFNVVIAIVSMLGLSLLYFRYIYVNEQDPSIIIIVIFLISLVISFFVYRFALKFLMTKIDLDKYFDPLFVSKYKKR